MIRILTAILLLMPMSLAAQDRIPSHCIALSEGVPGVRYAAIGGGAEIADEAVRLHYIGHSTYLLETASGMTVATDFTGFVGAGIVPDVVTMNRAHSSHYTLTPDPAIPHVLHGWGDENGPADHYLDLGEMLVRNVTTDVRSGFSGARPNDNSIFIFEVAGLCIGHLGHIHHEPSDTQYAMMGRLDVVMAPVDGGMTVPVETMITIMKRVKASLVLPMHWFGDGTLARFAGGCQMSLLLNGQMRLP